MREDLIDPTVGMEGHSLRMVEQEDFLMNGQDQENQGEMDMIEIDQEEEINMVKKEKRKEKMTEVGNVECVGAAVVKN